jgi:hypothetical protein
MHVGQHVSVQGASERQFKSKFSLHLEALRLGGVPLSSIWHRLIWNNFIDVSENYTASLFVVEDKQVNSNKPETSVNFSRMHGDDFISVSLRPITQSSWPFVICYLRCLKAVVEETAFCCDVKPCSLANHHDHRVACSSGSIAVVRSQQAATVIHLDNMAILVTLVMEGTRSSETSFLTIVIWRHIPEDGIRHSLTEIHE